MLKCFGKSKKLQTLSDISVERTSFISLSLLSRSPFCQWQRRFAPALWTSATRVCCLQPPVRPRGRWAPSSPTSRPLMEPHSMQRASRRPSSCSETPAASANRALVRKQYCQTVVMLHVRNVQSCLCVLSEWSVPALVRRFYGRILPFAT